VPVRSKAFFPQAAHGPLGEITILKTAAGERDALFADAAGNFDNTFD